jgi:SAM-dependent methyltransferase
MEAGAEQRLLRHGLSNPFAKSVPDALGGGRCGICHGNAFQKFLECRSLDSEFAPLYVCRICGGIYNATAEFNQLDVVEWQQRWAEDPEFYKVPSGKEFEAQLEEARVTIRFFEDDLGFQFSGNYVEIGAGSGIMAAAALKHFDRVYVFDHVQDRLQQVREIVGKDYHVMDFEGLSDVSADAVLIWHAMEHFLDPGGVFQMAAAILNPGGYFLIQVPVLSEEHVYPGHYYFYSEPTFRLLANKFGLNVEHFYYDHALNAMTVALKKNSAAAAGLNGPKGSYKELSIASHSAE